MYIFCSSIQLHWSCLTFTHCFSGDPSTLNDETLVCSLFDSDPDIIGEIAYLLDIQKSGVKNWSFLAPKLGIPRKIFKSFENSSTDNPTENLFEILIVHFPKLTVGELIDHLEAIKRRDVIRAIEKSTMGKSHPEYFS